MGLLTDTNQIEQRLRDALRGSRDWVFLGFGKTRDKEFRRLHIDLAANLTYRNLDSEKCIDYGELNFEGVGIDFLLIPKKLMPLDAMNHFLRQRGERPVNRRRLFLLTDGALDEFYAKAFVEEYGGA